MLQSEISRSWGRYTLNFVDADSDILWSGHTNVCSQPKWKSLSLLVLSLTLILPNFNFANLLSSKNMRIFLIFICLFAVWLGIFSYFLLILSILSISYFLLILSMLSYIYWLIIIPLQETACSHLLINSYWIVSFLFIGRSYFHVIDINPVMCCMFSPR